jgi:hypothetical protein
VWLRMGYRGGRCTFILLRLAIVPLKSLNTKYVSVLTEIRSYHTFQPHHETRVCQPGPGPGCWELGTGIVDVVKDGLTMPIHSHMPTAPKSFLH